MAEKSPVSNAIKKIHNVYNVNIIYCSCIVLRFKH